MRVWSFEIGDWKVLVYETRWIVIGPKDVFTHDSPDIKEVRQVAQNRRDVMILTKVPFLQSGKLYNNVKVIADILNKYPDIANKYVENLFRLRDAETYEQVKEILDWYFDIAVKLLERERPDLYDMYVNYEIKADQRTGILDPNHTYVLRAVVFLTRFILLPLMYRAECITEDNCPKLPYNTDIIKTYTIRLFGKHDNLYNNILLLIKAIARGRFAGIFEKLETMNKKTAAEEEAYTLYHVIYSALLQLSEDAQSLGTVTKIIQSKYLVAVREKVDHNMKPVETLSMPMSLRLPNVIAVSHNLKEAIITQTYLLKVVKDVRQYMPRGKPSNVYIPLSEDWFVQYVILPAFYKSKNIKSAAKYILTEEMLSAIKGYVLDKGLVHQGLAKYLYMVQMPIPIQIPYPEYQQLKKIKQLQKHYLSTITENNTFVYSIRDNKVYLFTRNGRFVDIHFTKILQANQIDEAYNRLIELIPPELEDTLVPYLKERIVEMVYGHMIDTIAGRPLQGNKTDLIKQYFKFFEHQFDLEPLLVVQ